MNKKQPQITKVLNYLSRLSRQIRNTTDYLSIAKYQENIDKIKRQINSQGLQKDKKQIKRLLQSCELLIQQKVNQFKKKIKIIANNKQYINKQLRNQNIRHYKSDEHLYKQPKKQDKARQQKDNKITNKMKLNSVAFKSQANNQSTKNFFNFFKQTSLNLSDEKSQAEDQFILQQKSQIILEEYKIKIREKISQNNEIRKKNQYLVQQNIELKDRILSEQKRQNIYFQELKEQINKLNYENEALIRQKKRSHQQKEQFQRDKQQYVEYVNKLQREIQKNKLKEHKSRLEESQLNKNYHNDIQRQLNYLSKQDSFLKEIELRIQQEKYDKQQLYKKYQILQKYVQEFQNQLKMAKDENLKLENTINRMKQNQIMLHNKILLDSEIRNNLQNELNNVILQLKQISKQFLAKKSEYQHLKNQKQHRNQFKVCKLKTLKSLLQQIK